MFGTRKGVVIILMLVFAASLWALAGKKARYPEGPQLTFDQSLHDFGDIDNLSPVMHSFLISNTGDSPLHIGEIRTSCGCTSANLSGEIIMPASTATLMVTFDPRGYHGTLKKYIAVLSDDPRRDSTIFTVTANAIERIGITPAGIIFEDLNDESRESKDVILKVVDSSAAFHLTKVTTESPNVSITSEMITPGHQYVLHVSIQPPLKIGSFHSSIVVGTDNPAYKQIIIPMQGHVVGELAIWPPVFNLDADYPTEKELIALIGPGKLRTFSLVSVDPPQASNVVKIYDLKEKGYAIGLRHLDIEQLEGKFLKITTSGLAMHQITIPFVIQKPQLKAYATPSP